MNVTGMQSWIAISSGIAISTRDRGTDISEEIYIDR
jgi:hypothetical protein